MSKPTHAKVRGNEAHRTQTRDFLKLIASVQTNEAWREEQTLSHWLTAACCSLRGATLLFNHEKQTQNEETYMQVVRACRYPKETMHAFSEALGVVTAALEAEASDFLTPVFSEIAASSHLAQFFTPYHLSLTCAKMVLQDAKVMLDQAQAEGRRFITCMEPACGVGGMIMAAGQVFREQGIDPSKQVHWIARDLDLRAVQGCYIQTTLSGASVVVEHGNSISGEVFDRMHTWAAVTFPKFMRMDRPVPPEVKAAEVVAEQTAQPQFSFDFARESAA